MWLPPNSSPTLQRGARAERGGLGGRVGDERIKTAEF